MNDSSMRIQVDFSRAFALFPLDGVVLLPHALLPLHIFEPRYVQMIEDALEGSRQIAMAVFQGDQWQDEYYGSPQLRPSVCVGQIARCEEVGGERFHVLLQGICRASIKEELLGDDDRLYRQAYLEPIEQGEPTDDELFMVRDGVMTSLNAEPLSELASVQAVTRELESRDIPTSALLEVVTLSILKDKGLQYRLLSEGDVFRRGEIVEHELGKIGRVLQAARRQVDPDAFNGATWN